MSIAVSVRRAEPAEAAAAVDVDVARRSIVELWGLRELALESTERASRFYERLGYRSSGGPRGLFGVLRAYPYVKTLR